MRLFPLLLAAALAACTAEAPAPPADTTAAEVRDVPAAPDTAALELREATADEILAHFQQHPARLHLVNFWATWCLPCVQEFPELVRVAGDYRAKGVAMTFVSADFPENGDAARAFLQDHGVAGVQFIKGGTDDDAFIAAFDPGWMGELPTTFIYDAAGRRVQSWKHKVDYALVAAALDSLLTQP